MNTLTIEQLPDSFGGLIQNWRDPSSGQEYSFVKSSQTWVSNKAPPQEVAKTIDTAPAPAPEPAPVQDKLVYIKNPDTSNKSSAYYEPYIRVPLSRVSQEQEYYNESLTKLGRGSPSNITNILTPTKTYLTDAPKSSYTPPPVAPVSSFVPSPKPATAPQTGLFDIVSTKVSETNKSLSDFISPVLTPLEEWAKPQPETVGIPAAVLGFTSGFIGEVKEKPLEVAASVGAGVLLPALNLPKAVGLGLGAFAVGSTGYNIATSPEPAKTAGSEAALWSAFGVGALASKPIIGGIKSVFETPKEPLLKITSGENVNIFESPGKKIIDTPAQTIVKTPGNTAIISKPQPIPRSVIFESTELPKVNLQAAANKKVFEDIAWKDYEGMLEAKRYDLIDKKYPTPEPAPVKQVPVIDLSKDLIRLEPDFSVPPARDIFPYGEKYATKLTDRLVTPGEELVPFPKAKMPEYKPIKLPKPSEKFDVTYDIGKLQGVTYQKTAPKGQITLLEQPKLELIKPKVETKPIKIIDLTKETELLKLKPISEILELPKETGVTYNKFGKKITDFGKIIDARSETKLKVGQGQILLMEKPKLKTLGVPKSKSVIFAPLISKSPTTTKQILMPLQSIESVMGTTSKEVVGTKSIFGTVSISKQKPRSVPVSISESIFKTETVSVTKPVSITSSIFGTVPISTSKLRFKPIQTYAAKSALTLATKNIPRSSLILGKGTKKSRGGAKKFIETTGVLLPSDMLRIKTTKKSSLGSLRASFKRPRVRKTRRSVI